MLELRQLLRPGNRWTLQGQPAETHVDSALEPPQLVRTSSLLLWRYFKDDAESVNATADGSAEEIPRRIDGYSVLRLKPIRASKAVKGMQVPLPTQTANQFVTRAKLMDPAVDGRPINGAGLIDGQRSTGKRAVVVAVKGVQNGLIPVSNRWREFVNSSQLVFTAVLRDAVQIALAVDCDPLLLMLASKVQRKVVNGGNSPTATRVRNLEDGPVTVESSSIAAPVDVSSLVARHRSPTVTTILL